jgi:hypothetical protein
VRNSLAFGTSDPVLLRNGAPISSLCNDCRGRQTLDLRDAARLVLSALAFQNYVRACAGSWRKALDLKSIRFSLLYDLISSESHGLTYLRLISSVCGSVRSAGSLTCRE